MGPAPSDSSAPRSSTPSAARPFRSSPGRRSFAEVVSSAGAMAAIPPLGAGGPSTRAGAGAGAGADVSAGASGAGARQPGPGSLRRLRRCSVRRPQ